MRSVLAFSLIPIAFFLAGCDANGPTESQTLLKLGMRRTNAQQTIPFHTSSYAFHTIDSRPEPGCDATGESRIYLTGSGAATHLGHYTVTFSFCAESDGTLRDGRGTFVAANGDLLHFTFEGTSSFVPPYSVAFQSHATFTGGSGRFENATGGAVVTGALDVMTGGGDGSWEGTISHARGD